MIRNKIRENKKTILYVDEIPSDAHFHVASGETLKLNFASFVNPLDGQIDIDVDENGYFEGAFADFSDRGGKFSININLNGRGAKCNWHLASLARGDAKKTFVPSVYHNNIETYALMSNYGIARDSSKLVFSGTSYIKNGSKKTNTRQEAKIIVFDATSDGKALPIIKIDENDVAASHAAIVGRLNEQHLFYLESRGISEEDAKRIISLGYLKPIEDYFEDEETLRIIDRAIEGGI